MTDTPPESSAPSHRAGSRFLRLAGMTARISSDVARDRWQRLWHRDEDRTASDAALYSRIGRDIAQTLGEMKGAVMKVGQVVSQYRDVLPAELVDALTPLQKDSPPRPFAELLPRLQQALGPDWRAHFSEVDETALASASIAQVHRARTRDGRDVVLKIQYPGVEEAIDSDLKQLRLALKIARVLPVSGHLLDALFDEIRTSLERELDYGLEAMAIERFRQFHADQPQVVIPAVITPLSSRHVLTLSHEPGDPLSSLDARYDQDRRDALGRLLFDTLARQLYQLHCLHCDPHPGNFAARPDGSLVVYDFGCIKELPDTLVQDYAALTRAALASDPAAVETGLIRLGARNTQHAPSLPGDFYQPWLQLAGDVLADSPVDFATMPLAEQVLRLSRKALPQWRAFQPVPDLVLVNRALGGHYWNLRLLGARIAMRPLLLHLATAPQS